MPNKPRLGKVIPILRKKDGRVDFRFVGGKLNTEPAGSRMVWASCMPKTEKAKPPTTMSRSLGSIGGVVTFKIAQPLKFPSPCKSDFQKQIDTRELIRQ